MSKASDSREFRSVDVDAYDEDQYEDDTNEDTGIAAEVTQRTEQVWGRGFCPKPLNTPRQRTLMRSEDSGIVIEDQTGVI